LLVVFTTVESGKDAKAFKKPRSPAGAAMADGALNQDFMYNIAVNAVKRFKPVSSLVVSQN